VPSEQNLKKLANLKRARGRSDEENATDCNLSDHPFKI
jgi:hypothetical protein